MLVIKKMDRVFKIAADLMLLGCNDVDNFIGSSFGIILGAPVLILVGLAPKSDLFCWMVVGLILVYLVLLYLLIFKAHRRKK
jgi:ESS family glutamate:Na+ symporter